LNGKAEDKAVKYSLQRVGQMEELIESIRAKQEIMIEKVRNTKLEERIIEYMKDKEIQEERYKEILKSNYNVTKYAEELKNIIGASNTQPKNSIRLGNIKTILSNENVRYKEKKFITTSFVTKPNNRKINASFQNVFKGHSTPISKLLGTTVAMIHTKQARSENGATPKPIMKICNFEDTKNINPFIKIYGKIKQSSKNTYADQ